MDGFKHAIGDFVSFKTDSSNPDAVPSLVIGRLMQECPGGIQRHYKLRSFRTEDNGTIMHCEMMLLDIEVEAWTPWLRHTKASQPLPSPPYGQPEPDAASEIRHPSDESGS